MALSNRVRPDGAFAATPARGTLMGNRGILHDACGRIGSRRWAHRGWVCCELSFKGRRRSLLTPGHYTELFFLDEAVALAAGHRPCGECRHADLAAWRAAWRTAFGSRPPVSEMDRLLHAARAMPGARRLRHDHVAGTDLPDHAVFAHRGRAWLRLGATARPYGSGGWGAAESLPAGMVTSLTNPVARAVLAAGYRPRLHPTAGR